MIRTMPIFRLRIGLILFSVLVLLVGTWTQASVPVAGSAVMMVICSDGAMKTVRLEGQGDHHRGPHECRHCQACDVPVLGPVPVAASASRLAWGPAGLSQLAADAALSWRANGRLARGPPFPSSRSRIFAAVLPRGSDEDWANARTIPA